MFHKSFGHHFRFVIFSFLFSCRDGGTESLPSESTPLDQRYIVRLDPSLNQNLDDFCHYLNSINVNHSVAHDYTQLSPDNFFGGSIRLDDLNDAQKLAGARGVKSITPVTIWKPIHPVSSLFLEKPPIASKNSEGFSPHIQTRVTDLHARGIFGQGVKVAFIDSGIDCGHPALGDFGPGKKIAFGYDLVGDDYSAGNELRPRANPCTPCGAHGTHVAGIVGAADLGYGFQGVAPNATLGMYRVIGCDSEAGSSNDVVMSAILMAVRDGADVISASIGGVGGWSKGDAFSELVTKLVKQGTALIMAAGNEGSEGPFFAESPAAALNAIAIGSVDSTKRPISQLITSTGKAFPYYTGGSFNGTDLPVYATSPTPDNSHDACEPLPDSTPSLAKYVVLVRRGQCPFTQKVENLVAKGAVRVLFYMNSAEIVNLSNYITSAQVASLAKEDGERIFSELRTNPKLTVTFSQTGHSFVPSAHGGLVSSYSQYGPSYDSQDAQPSFLGVGGNILSTVPRRMGSYASMSGTSMATPQIAGIVALMKSVRGKELHALKLKNILSTTAQQVKATAGKDDIETVVHAGGGLVDAFCACLAQTVISTDALALQDLSNFKSEHTFTITNEGDQPRLFNTGHIPANTINTFAHGASRVSTDVQTVPGSSAKVQVMPGQFTLAPKASQTIRVVFTPPTGLSSELLPIYSGYISLISDGDCERHTLPYYGIAGVLKDVKIIQNGPDTGDFTTVQLPRLTNGERQPHAGPFTFQGSNSVVVRYRLAFGTQYSRMDIISANSTLNPKAASGDAIHSFPEIVKNFTISKPTFMGARLIGKIPNSDDTYSPRTSVDDTIVQPWDGTVVPPGKQSAVKVPNGNYKILIRALKVNGNPNNDVDFDHWESSVVSVAR